LNSSIVFDCWSFPYFSPLQVPSSWKVRWRISSWKWTRNDWWTWCESCALSSKIIEVKVEYFHQRKEGEKDFL
jgi:hypothetical protein